jgi:hypothetical protein
MILRVFSRTGWRALSGNEHDRQRVRRTVENQDDPQGHANEHCNESLLHLNISARQQNTLALSKVQWQVLRTPVAATVLAKSAGEMPSPIPLPLLPAAAFSVVRVTRI